MKDKPVLSVAQAPTFCRLCDVEFRGRETWRAHLKSDGHVYKLRLKNAEPGSIISPPASPEPPKVAQSKGKSLASSSHDQQTGYGDLDVDDDGDDDEDEIDGEGDSEDDELSVPDFNPNQCLFCDHDQQKQDPNSLDANITHMTSAHGFTIPFRDFLAVDTATVLRFLHFVIHGYRECICCGTRRSTVEGVRQHMLAKGHCRFDVGPDTEELYEMPQEEEQVMTESARQDASVPVRLPSGKIISHRKVVEVQEPRMNRRAGDQKPDRRSRLESYTQPKSGSSSSRPSSSTEVATRRGGNDNAGGGQVMRSSEALLAAQMSRLMVASNREQIKLEKRKRFRVDRKNNLTLSKHFKVDAGDSRAGRQFCC